MIGLEKSIIGEDNRIGLFGVGYIYRKEHHKFENLSICALIDNDESKQGQVINGVRVITPYEAVHSLDYIIVTSNYFKEIKKQLIELGFEESHVIHYSESDFICYSLEDRSVAQKMYLSYQADSRHSVALVSNEMSFTGAPVVLLEVGKILVKNGFSVKAVTASKGSLSEAYRKCGIDVLYDPYFKPYNKELWEWLDGFEYVMINTLIIKDMIWNVRNIHSCCIWWIHESDERVLPVKDQCFIDSFSKNLRIYGVGERVIKSLNSIWPGIEVKNLLYGLPDTGNGKRAYSHISSKVAFACIGSFYRVKGQDIFVKAIALLPDHIKNNAEFFVAGRILDNRFFDALFEYGVPIKYLGELTREEICEFYKRVDFVVCPSRRDSMPTVTVEAMMNYRIPIVSEVVGTAEYIEDGVSGYVCRKEDAEDLARAMTTAFDDMDHYEVIANESRKIYERYFTMELFEKNIRMIFE